MATPASTIHPLTQPLLTSLQTRYALSPAPTWLSHFLATARQPLPPLPALTQTAHFRLLASDLTATLLTTNPTTLLPPNISDISIKEVRLHPDGESAAAGGAGVPVQVLDIQDVGSSKWAQVEAIERVERGEEVRGREVIRTVAVLDDRDDDADGNATGGGGRRAAGAVSNSTAEQGQQASAKRSHGPHKLIVQDAAGTKAVAFELESVPRLFIGGSGSGNGIEANGNAVEGMSIGCKMVLQPGTLVRRGMIMLTPANVRVLGGKIEPWDRKWREDRKKRLIEEVVAATRPQEE